MWLLLVTSSTNFAQTNPVTHEVEFSYYSQTLEHWYNLTMNDNSYVISSDDAVYDGWSSDFNYFNWYIFEDLASDSGFFNMDQIDQDPIYILTYTRLEQSNTISVKDFEENLNTNWANLIFQVFDYQQRILLIDYTALVWPVASQLFVLTSYPEQYSFSVIFQRGNDNARTTLGQNVSLFVGVDFDMNTIEEWMENSTYSDTVYMDSFTMGTTTNVQFPHFFLRKGNIEEVEAYPLERVTFMVVMDNRMTLLYSFSDQFKDFVFEISFSIEPTKYIHDYIPYVTIDDTSDLFEPEDTNGELFLPIPVFSIIIGIISLQIVKRKRLLNQR